MLAQISTTHIHKQIEPVLPYVNGIKNHFRVNIYESVT